VPGAGEDLPDRAALDDAAALEVEKSTSTVSLLTAFACSK